MKVTGQKHVNPLQSLLLVSSLSRAKMQDIRSWVVTSTGILQDGSIRKVWAAYLAVLVVQQRSWNALIFTVDTRLTLKFKNRHVKPNVRFGMMIANICRRSRCFCER